MTKVKVFADRQNDFYRTPASSCNFNNIQSPLCTGTVLTLGTCGLNSTALCIASTAVISAVLSPRLDAMSGENLELDTYLRVISDAYL